MFEGLGLGSRLSTLSMPHRLRYVPVLAGLLYGITTPIGIAAGLGIRSSYNPNTPLASIVSGVLDSLSAGILVYTGLVEVIDALKTIKQNMVTDYLSNSFLPMSSCSTRK
jgi:solute carrier family 39 (zinc transporter), member 1/2/3